MGDERSGDIHIGKTILNSVMPNRQHYRQQIEIATLEAERCENDVDRATWLRIAEEWQRLHDVPAYDVELPNPDADGARKTPGW